MYYCRSSAGTDAPCKVRAPFSFTPTASGCLNPAGQGIECHFLEQWHQKLHTNTTPEDITICEAYLAFLGSGYDGDFWQTLWDRGHITRDMLATMDHPITGVHSLL